jgi:hypothetical protein
MVLLLLILKRPALHSPRLRFSLIIFIAAGAAASFQLTFFAVSGMETVIQAFLVLFLFYRLSEKPVFDYGNSVLSMLIFLGRAEGFIIPAAVIAYLLFMRIKDGKHKQKGKPLFDKKEKLSLIIFAVFVVLFLLSRLLYFGDIVPNTFYAKLPWATGSRVHWLFKGFDDIVLFFSLNGGPLLIIVLSFALFPKGKENRSVLPVLFFLAVYLFFQKWVGGDWMLGARFLIPVAPLAAAGMLIGLKTAADMLKERKAEIILTYAIIAASFLMAGKNIEYAVEFEQKKGGYPVNVMTSNGLPELGIWLKEHIPPDYLMRAYRIGAIGYYSGLRIIDDHGLTNKKVAKIKGSGTAEEQKEKVLAYIRSLQPDLIIWDCNEKNPPEPGYLLIHEAYSGSQCMGVWVKEDNVKKDFDELSYR